MTQEGAAPGDPNAITVLQILYSGLGGHGSVAYSLVEADTRRRWNPVLVFVGIEPLLPAYIDRGRQLGIPFHFVQATAGKPWKHWWTLFRILSRARAPVVLMHSLSALIPATCYAWLFRKLLLAVEHTPNIVKTKGEWWLSGATMICARNVVVLTEEYRDELARKLGKRFRPDKIVLIPNGIDTDRYRPPIAPPVRRSRAVRLGMAARFSPTKRQDVLVRMMTILRHEDPSTEWSLSLAGDGQCLDDVARLARTLGLDQHVTIEGNLDEDDLVAWFQSLDICVHASSGEALSTSLLQALACGLPVVASDVPGIRNLLRTPPACGLLAKADQPEEYARLVRRLATERESAAELGRNGRTLVVSRYGNAAMFDAYAALVSRHTAARSSSTSGGPARHQIS